MGTNFMKSLVLSDFKTRKKGLCTVKHHFLLKKGLLVDNLLKISKCLYFYFWQSDIVREQIYLGNRISSLVLKTPLDTSIMYFDSFFKTIRREWFSIDILRLDKFMILVRKFLRHMFTVLCRENWPIELTRPFITSIGENVLLRSFDEDGCPATGLGHHLCDIYLTELSKFCCDLNGNSPKETTMSLIQPFIKVLIFSNKGCYILVVRCKEGIFFRLVDEFPILYWNDVVLFSVFYLHDMLFNFLKNRYISQCSRLVIYECCIFLKKSLKSLKKKNLVMNESNNSNHE